MYNPQHSGLTDEQVKSLYDAAEILAACWPTPFARVLAPLMVEVAIHRMRSGVTARKNWIASLRALSQALDALIKMEAAKTRHPSDIR